MASETEETESTSALTLLSCQLQNCSISTPIEFSPLDLLNPLNNDDFTLQEGGKTYLCGEQMPAIKGKKKGWFWNYGEEIYYKDNMQWLGSMKSASAPPRGGAREPGSYY